MTYLMRRDRREQLQSEYGVSKQLFISHDWDGDNTATNEAAQYIQHNLQMANALIENGILFDAEQWFDRQKNPGKYSEISFDEAPNSSRSEIDSFFTRRTVVMAMQEIVKIPWTSTVERVRAKELLKKGVSDLAYVMLRSGAFDSKKSTRAKLQSSTAKFMAYVKEIKQLILGDALARGSIDTTKVRASSNLRRDFPDAFKSDQRDSVVAEEVNYTGYSHIRAEMLMMDAAQNFPKYYREPMEEHIQANMRKVTTGRPENVQLNIPTPHKMGVRPRTNIVLKKRPADVICQPALVSKNNMLRLTQVQKRTYAKYIESMDPLSNTRQGEYSNGLSLLEDLGDYVEHSRSGPIKQDDTWEPFTTPSKIRDETKGGQMLLRDSMEATTSGLTSDAQLPETRSTTRIDQRVLSDFKFLEEDDASEDKDMRDLWDDLGLSVSDRLDMAVQYSENPEACSRFSCAMRAWNKTARALQTYRKCYKDVKTWLRHDADTVSVASRSAVYESMRSELMAYESSVIVCTAVLKGEFGEHLPERRAKIESELTSRRARLVELCQCVGLV